MNNSIFPENERKTAIIWVVVKIVQGTVVFMAPRWWYCWYLASLSVAIIIIYITWTKCSLLMHKVRILIVLYFSYLEHWGLLL